MIQALIGKKIDQSQTFLENGQRIPVTEVAVGNNVVVQVKTKDTDTYAAIQLGYGTKKKPTKALLGHAKKAKLEEVPSIMKEVAWIGDDELPTVGDAITVGSVFKPGDIIQVTGTSKGKGFAGTVKRYNFRGGPKTHGQSDRHRAPGSIGQGTTPGRVYKGKRMAGHMGVDTVTVRNLTVVDVDEENNKLYVLGLVPGHKQATLLITRMGEQKNFVRLLSVKQKEDALAAEEAARVEKEQAEAAKAAEKTAAKEAAKEANTSEAEATKEEVKAEAPQEAEAPATGVEEVKAEETETTEEAKDEAKTEEKEQK